VNTVSRTLAPSAGDSLVVRVAACNALLGRVPLSLTQLVLRIALAVPFFRSGLTKWEGWFQISDSAVYLFTQEFQLHLFGQSYAYPLPYLMALLSGTFEILLPVLLVIGLATRFAALGILVMTLVIQLTIPDGWANFHLPWAAMALAAITYGPGNLAADRLLSAANR
jgi:putative oxidoreductase